MCTSATLLLEPQPVRHTLHRPPLVLPTTQELIKQPRPYPFKVVCRQDPLPTPVRLKQLSVRLRRSVAALIRDTLACMNLINGYRKVGHAVATLDPLGLRSGADLDDSIPDVTPPA